MIIGVLIGKAEGRKKTPIEKILEEAMNKMADSATKELRAKTGKG
jgi:hypothetical protein